MTFEEVLAQATEILQREQRVSYRALRRRLALDAEDLEDLKAELIQAKRLARDEDGVVLVWAGDIATPLAPAPPERPAAGRASACRRTPPAHSAVL